MIATSRPALPSISRLRRGGQWLRSPLLVGGLALLVLLPLFVALGQWQWQKGERKAAQQALRDTRGDDAAASLPPTVVSAAEAEVWQFRRVVLSGRFVPERQFLLDNQVYRERAGFHVITPFRLDGSDTVVLVNRGWLPAGASHQDLPAITTPDQRLNLSGVAVLPPRRFFSLSASGNTPDWSSATLPLPLWQRLDLDAFAQQSGFAATGVHHLIVQLDAAAPAGFERAWPRPDERIERHYSYALQWYGFAITAIGIWGFFLVRRLRP